MSILNIFMYHRVLPEPSEDGVSVTTFARQLDVIRQRYEVLNGDDLLAVLEGRRRLAGPGAALTFDDGWLDNWLIATPVLKEKGVPAILALSSGYLHDGPLRGSQDREAATVRCDVACDRALNHGSNGAFLSRAEVKAMVDAGVWTIEAHGHTHARSYYRLDLKYGLHPASTDWTLKHALGGGDPFPGAPVGELVSDLACPRRVLNPQLLERLRRGDHASAVLAEFAEPVVAAESAAEYRERLRLDLQRCRQAIVDIAGRAPQFLFWPWGEYSEAGLNVAREVGFRYTLSTEKGMVRVPSDAFVLPRIGVGEKWGRFRRNLTVFTCPVCATLHGWLSPSPSGRRG